MRTVWKYVIPEAYGGGLACIRMPKGAKILHVQNQRGTPHMWVEVDPDAVPEKRYFEVFGTGHLMHEDMGIERRYLGTLLSPDERFVWHYYERTDP